MGFKYVNILEMPICRQAHNFTCGVACVQSAIRFAGYDFDTREDSLLKALGTTPENGTNYRKIAEFLSSIKHGGTEVFNKLEWGTFGNDNMDSVQALKEKLIGDNRRPVICIIQAWNDSGVYSSTSNDDGHYVIAIGIAVDFNERNYIIFMDPSTLGRYAYIPENELGERWHDSDGETTLNYYGLILNYVTLPDSEQNTFYKLG